MSRHRKLSCLIPCLLVLVAAPVMADPLTITVTPSLGENVAWSFNGAGDGGFAGSFSTFIQPSGPAFDSFCVDLYHYFYPGQSWTVTPTTTASFGGNTDVPAGQDAGGNGTALGTLYNAYDPGIATSADPNLAAAALQVALWSVDYNGTTAATNAAGNHFVFTSDGNGDVQSRVFALANADITSLATLTPSNAGLFLPVDHPDGSPGFYQDLVGVKLTPGGANPFAVVPEPSSLLMLAAGLGPVAFGSRKALRGA